MMHQRKVAVLGAVLVGAAGPTLAANQLSLAVGAGLESHSNAGLTNTNEQSDLNRLLNADIAYKKPDGNIRLDLDYSAKYNDYRDNVQRDQTAVDGRAAVRWLIAPRAFDVFLNHLVSQQITNQRVADTTNNQQRRSVLQGGANGYLHLSGVDSIVLTPSYTEVNYQNSTGTDSKRSSAALAWQHLLSPVSSLALTGSYSDVKFDNSDNDYKATDAMLTLRTALSRLGYQIGVGATRFNRDVGKDFTGMTALVAADYHGDDGQDWGASYIRQLTDTSIGLAGISISQPGIASGIESGVQVGDSNSNQFDVVQIDNANLYWRARLGASHAVNFGVGYRKENYKETPRDQNIGYVQAGYQYTINSRWSTGVDGRYERTHFLDAPEDKYNTTYLRLNATYRPSQPLEVRFSVGQNRRTSDTSATNQYTDRVVSVGFLYRVF